ncbi:hypothetical protein GPJ56_007454 [Histomonas meleagridis]|uniref:uncharacterized protein n=1 Tax=Histomonas meleagridis TaxID=135588 RepID=UPI00355985A2|nr:hypothetical protein GPJ56_007454 [Histomonas meleagridis]KAH0804300.1 hypothetical protein GO595_003130 [Histomonas meleagridis]
MEHPICRQEQYAKLLYSLKSGSKIILLSGPVSSGKTITVNFLIDQVKDTTRCVHLYCDTGDTISDVLTSMVQQLSDEETKIKKISSFQQITKYVNDEVETIIVFDSFDLLEDGANDLLAQSIAVIDSHILTNFTFIFVTHVNPSFFRIDPFSITNIIFPAYDKPELEQIILSAYNKEDDESFGVLVRKIITISEPMTKDIRDIIFICHSVSGAPQKTIGKEILKCLDTMRIQKVCRIDGLSTVASVILLAVYIASKTSTTSDLMRFARSLKKKRRSTKLLEDHEYVSLERVFAISKALFYSHLFEIDFDYSAYLQVQQLERLALIEIRGDIYREPKLKCLANEQEISTIAANLDIHVHEYVTEK